MASVREEILKLVKAKLETITTGNGYGNTIASVQRFTESGIVTKDVPYIVIHEGDETPGHEPEPATHYELDVELEVVTRHDEAADARSSEEICNSLRADIRKAMASNRQWNNLACNTKPLGSTGVFVFEGQPDLTFVMQTTIEYRTRADDPSVAI